MVAQTGVAVVSMLPVLHITTNEGYASQSGEPSSSAGFLVACPPVPEVIANEGETSAITDADTARAATADDVLLVSRHIGPRGEPWSSLAIQLRNLRALRLNWERADIPMPSVEAVDIAESILSHAEELGVAPRSLGPSVEGGVGISFCGVGLYGDIECLNDGAAFVVRSGKGRAPIVEQFVPRTEAIEQVLVELKRHIGG